MGLGNSAGNAIFLSISNGKVCRQVSSPTSTSKSRINKNGKEVHEEFYDHVSGKIVDIEVREHPEYGKDWNVILEDGSDRYNLQFKYSSGYANGFLKALPNVDLSQPVTLIPNQKEENAKKRTTVFISQNGNPVKWYYTKDHPNGLPQLKQVKVKGQMTWDDSDMMEFLEAMVRNEIKPKLKPAPVVAGDEVEDNASEEAPF